jgi:formate dehydrogenase assembly factor FdhD
VENKNNTQHFTVFQCRSSTCDPVPMELIGEEPLLIRIEDHPYSVVMRTPGEEIRHAAGFCLGEGLVSNPDDIRTMGYDVNLEPNIIDVWLTAERQKKVGHLLKRKGFVSQTSCGICGKEMLKDIQSAVAPAADGFRFSLDRAFDCVAALSKNQKFYQRTRGRMRRSCMGKMAKCWRLPRTWAGTTAWTKRLERRFWITRWIGHVSWCCLRVSAMNWCRKRPGHGFRR